MAAGTGTIRDRGSPSRRPAPIDDTAIVVAALRHFARDGFQACRVADIAADLGIAKGSIFKHFGSKEELFLAAYRRAASSLPAYLDAPDDVLDAGFWATIGYWLERSEHLVRDDWVPYRVVLIGNYATDLRLKQKINRWLAEEDPYGTKAFVAFGIERGEVRKDIDAEMTVSIVDWLMEKFQDALVTNELDQGLFVDRATTDRIGQFTTVLRGAIGAPAGDAV
jgi:TetR/AcrR family transcriptional regulator